MLGQDLPLRTLEKVIAPLMAALPVDESERLVSIDTRFGVVEFDRAQTITFPKGIPGFQGYGEFGLCRVPNCEQTSLMLLQSIEPRDLSFIVMPHDPAAGTYQDEELEEALLHLGINAADCAMLLIVSFQQVQDDHVMCVNLRAPLLIDGANRLAWQHIMTNDRYAVRHMLET